MGKIWDIKLEDIKNMEPCPTLAEKWRRARSVMDQRTRYHGFFAKVSHNLSLYDFSPTRQKTVFSEGSTQAIKRKLRAQTIQRVPDGDITTQFDKNSIEQAVTEFIFEKKVLCSEYEGKDMMKNLWRSFNASYDYGYACVRTGFEKDVDGDYRISYTNIGWHDIYPAPDCRFIEEAPWYMVREYMSLSDLKELVDWDTLEVTDPTYNADVVKYMIDNPVKDGPEPTSVALADRQNGASVVESFEIRTCYARGADEFVTWVPSLNAVLRTVKNYDPRKDVPIHFMILEPDPEFPLGCSSIMWTLAQQQFADAFQTSSYQTLLLATQPPIMGFGNLTNSAIKMKPRSFWPMGTNPNNKIEKFQVETTTLTNYGQILENVSSNMMKNLNVADGTIAADADTMSYSGTPQGVEAQRQDKTITINQYQKRVEIFFSEWANHALRSYINAMGGTHELTVDEDTRRRIWDIEMAQESEESIIDGDKIKIDFDRLSTDLLSFEVRTGSLIESQRDTERKNIQELIVPLSQMMNAVSDENKPAFEDTLMRLVQRLCELSDIDVASTTGKNFDEALFKKAMQATMEQVMQQQGQLQQQQQQIGQLAGMIGNQQQGAPQEQVPPPQVPEQTLPPGPGGQQLNSGVPNQTMTPGAEPVSAEFPTGAQEPGIPTQAV